MKCPLCGGKVTYIGAVSVECDTRGCKNYKAPDPHVSRISDDDFAKMCKAMEDSYLPAVISALYVPAKGIP